MAKPRKTKSGDTQKRTATPKKPKKEITTVRFTASPSGAFGLAYHHGDTATVNKELADSMVAAGICEIIKVGK